MEHITFVPEPLIYSSLQCRVLMNNLLSACGDNEFFFFTESGKLYTFGSNDWGQLGHGNTVQLSRPKLVKRKWLMQTKNKKKTFPSFAQGVVVVLNEIFIIGSVKMALKRDRSSCLEPAFS